MNRMDEYAVWLAQVEASPLPSGQAVLQAATVRLRRRQWVTQPIFTLVTVLMLFTALVNLCAPVAYACSRLPVLRQLAQAVTFSQSLTAAVENDYVQSVAQSQTQDDITASVDYLIVDARQVNIFYHLESDVYTSLYAQPEVTDEAGNALSRSYYSTGSLWDADSVLRQLTLDFMDEDVPEAFVLTLHAAGSTGQDTQNQETSVWDDPWTETVPEITTAFAFSLSIAPAQSSNGQIIALNTTIELDGQTITLTDCEIYPTHLRLNLAADEANTAWLTDLDFYVEGDDGQLFSTIGNGVSATGSTDSPMMDSYRAESPWFYDAQHLTLVITGARWLDKDMTALTLDLTTGSLTPCPKNLTLESVTKTENGWEFCLTSQTDSTDWAFLSDITTPAGISVDRLAWTQVTPDPDDPDADPVIAQTYTLPDYPYDWVILQPSATKTWTAQTPLTIALR